MRWAPAFGGMRKDMTKPAKLVALLIFTGCARAQVAGGGLATDLETAIERVSEKFDVPVGLEYRISAAKTRLVRFPYQARTAQTALVSVVNQMAGYRLRFHAGVAHVYEAGVAQDRRNWLNATLNENLSAHSMTMREASAVLMQGAQEMVRARKGGGRGGSFPGTPEEPRITLQTRNAPIREYLNELVKVSRARMWVVRFSEMSTLTNGGFFEVASVGSGNSQGFPSLWALRNIRSLGRRVVKFPEVLLRVRPAYTEEARRLKNEGSVVLMVEVDPAGKPKVARVVRPLGNGLDEKAIEAVRKWRFRPMYERGKPITVTTTVEVEFQLR